MLDYASSPSMSPAFKTPRPLRRRNFAFSLVEVAMSLAIVTFALVGILGLVPVGLHGLRDAIDTTVCAQLAQRAITDAEQTDFDLLIAHAETSDASFFALPVRYFDEQGGEVLASDPQAEMKIIYHLRIRGSKPGPADSSAANAGFTSLPGAPRFQPRDSSFLTVQVAWRPGLAPLALDEARHLWRARSAPMRTYRAVITRNSRAVKTTSTP